MAQNDHLKTCLDFVRQKIADACGKRSKDNNCNVRLVAVSKTKPKELIIEAYNYGQRHFGENYIQELYEKSNDKEILEKCPDIKWHAIGHVQGNKMNKLLNVPNLFMIETIDSSKLAESVNKALENSSIDGDNKLKVMIQINTSGEQNKSGIDPSNAVSLITFIKDKCHNLQFMGLMTIGAYDYDVSKGPNPDFQQLLQCRENICKSLELEINSVELSMGMTADYEHAIEVGSTNIRVGTAIFGSRNYT